MASPEENASLSGLSSLAATPPSRKWKHIIKSGAITTDLQIPIEPWRRVVIVGALGLAGFMVGLDQTIIEPALPTIVTEFHSVHHIGAYTSAYLLPQCTLQPLCNKIYSLFSFAAVYVTSILLFCAGNIICATSASSPMFIVGRTLAGMGAVGLSIGGFRMLALLPENKEQNMSIGVFSLVLGSSVVAGPILGGVITQSIGWHWVFWINLPVLGIVLFLVLVGAFVLEGPDLRGERHSLSLREKLRLLDWLGTTLLVLTLVPLILAIDFGHTEQRGWAGPACLSMFALSAVSLFLLVLQQRTTTREVIFDPAILRRRSVWTTAGLFMSSLSSTSVLIVFLPFIFQKELGMSPRSSGLLTFPFAAAMTLSTFLFSIVSTLVPYFNPLALLGAALFLVSNALFLGLPNTVSKVVTLEVVAGLGLGMGWLAEIIFPRAVLTKHQLAESLGYTRMMQQAGAAVAVQVAAAAFATVLARELAALGPSVGVGEGGVVGAFTEAGEQVPAAATEQGALAAAAISAAYGRAIRAAYIPAIIWASLAMGFAVCLPWTRLKKGVTVRAEPPAEQELPSDVDADESQGERRQDAPPGETKVPNSAKPETKSTASEVAVAELDGSGFPAEGGKKKSASISHENSETELKVSQEGACQTAKQDKVSEDSDKSSEREVQVDDEKLSAGFF